MSKLALVIYIFIICHVNSYIAQATYNCYKESLCRQIGLSDGQACSTNGTSLVICSNWQEKVSPCKSNLCIQHSLDKAECLCPYNCSDRGVCQTEYQTCSCYRGFYGSHCEFIDYCTNKTDGFYCNENNVIHCSDGVTVQRAECPYKCVESNPSAASCACPNNCSGILNACSEGKCVCPPNKLGTDCSEINPCFGANGWICIGGSTSILCFDGAPAKTFSCPSGCNDITGGCKCLNDCSSNGRCVFDGLSGNTTCSCFEEFYGADCSLNNPCAASTHSTFCSNNDTLTRCGTAGDDPKMISCKYSCATIGTYMAKCRCHCYSWHYQHSLSCAEDGSCVCKEGWTGPECWTNMIPKRRAPGFCTGLVDGTFCAEDNQTLVMCRMGTQYSGVKCARGCLSSPLGNNAACECVLGDNGLPCSGRGVCMDTGTCSCNKGYFGEDCSHVDSCPDIPPDFDPTRTYHLCDGNKIAVCNSRKMYNLVYCPYGCTKGSSFGFDRCNCNCGNNSVGCNAPFGDCNCASGYSSCPPGLSGPDCTVPNNPCGGRDGRLCHNGLLLRCERGLNVSAITCTNGCHDADDSCACPSDCNNRGTCTTLGQCKCDAGWSGEDCSQLSDVCAIRESGGKFCTNSTIDGTGLITTCFKGKMINEELCPNGCASPFACYCPRNCSMRGQCVSGKCVCFKGWFGEDCSRSSFSMIVHVAPVVVGLALVVLGLHTYYAMKYKVRLVSLSDEHENLMDFAALETYDMQPSL